MFILEMPNILIWNSIACLHIEMYSWPGLSGTFGKPPKPQSNVPISCCRDVRCYLDLPTWANTIPNYSVFIETLIPEAKHN